MHDNLMVLAQAAGAAPGRGGMGGLFGNPLVPMVLFMAIIYFMMLRPQQRKEKERRKMIETLRAGQRVLFAGGLVGTITEAREHTFLIEVAHGVTIEVARGAVRQVLQEGDKPVADEARG
ncbi:MAG: preprotein translocase subunit YajC [Lentisphaerae bacterium]|nr:preprotein translocase subunit YajC [Lentisphaerota bacterium]